MRRIFTLPPLCGLLVLILSLGVSQQLVAQTANDQRVTTECYTGPTLSFRSTTGTLMPAVTFQQGAGPGRIPVGHVIADVIIEIEWSKTDDGSCTPSTGTVANLGDVGFTIFNNTLGSRYLATSNNTGGFALPPTTSTFSGTFPANSPGIIRNTTYFRDGFNRAYPYAPSSGDTIAPNNDPLSAYRGTNPIGNWQVGGIDDSPGFGSPELCIHSYCITLVTCPPTALQASCQAFPEVALDPSSGLHTFTFADLDSLSDVSCLVDNITFLPRTVNCSNAGTQVPVTMTIQDNLGNTSTCNSLVTVRDTSPPVIPYCAQPFGTPFTTLYLDANGVDSFFASSVPMSDNCGPIIKQVRNLSSNSPWRSALRFSCVTGLQQFWVRGVDAAGNVDSCRFVVEIRDTIPPTAVCIQDTLYVGNGAQTLSPINIDGGSNDFCPGFAITGRWIDAINAPNPLYDCSDLGQTTVSLIVRDGSNNFDTCTTTVTMVDTTAPTPICQNVTVYLNNTGAGTLTVGQVDNGSFDSCGIVSRTINGGTSISYSCADVGTPQTVVLRVEDGSSNADSCIATITVLDTIAPTAICRNATTFVNNTGVSTINASSLNNNSTDACSGTTLTYTINGNPTASFDCDDIATSPNQVVLTVTDANGNSSTCTANVTVQDTIDPTVACTNPTVYLGTNGLVNVGTAELIANSNDNCVVLDSSINVVGLTSVSYNCSAIFTPQVAQVIVRDASGNDATCNATINVVDTVNPTALCEAAYTAQLDGNGNAVVTPINIDSASIDNCGITTYLINNQPSQTYTCADVGTLSALLTVIDSSNNQATCRTDITVVDNTPPTASCRISTVSLSASGVAAITPNSVLAFPATNDNCGAITTSFAGGRNTIVYNCDSIGPRTVNVVVTDASGNTAGCQTTVTVRDTFAPTANCRPVPYTVQLDASGNGFVVPANVNNNSGDICGLDTLLVNGVDSFFYNCTNIGNTAVTLSVVDESGNQSTCVANVIVADNIPPVARCRDTTFYLGASGVVTVFPTAIDNGSTDNCSFTRRINNLPSFNYNCNQVGTNTAQLLITDGNGTSSQCSAQITIIDSISPTANCVAPSSITVFLDSTCFGSIPASRLNNNSQDNCSNSLTYRVNGLPNATFTAANLTTNPNQVTLEVCDGSNNCSTCNTAVIVRDNIPPTMVCRPDTVQLDGNGNAVVVPNNVNGGSRDNCSVPSYTINGGPVINFDCSNLGSNQVTLVGTDQSGNSDSCTTTVFVEDVTAPNASCNGTVTVVLDPTTSIGILTVAQVNNNSSDNCNIVNYSLSRTSFNCNDIPNNPHSITMVVTDQSGNTDSCTTLVTVEDNVDPTVLCRATPLNLALVGTTVSTTVGAIDNGSGDNCALATLTLSQTTFTCADIGSNTVTLTGTDSSGNTASCTATVIVDDVTDPTPFCNNPTVQLDANGNVGVAATDLNIGSVDNCIIDTVLVNGQDSVFFTCADLGSNTVTVLMADQSNNTASCPSTITVEDNVSPVARCVAGPVPVQLDPNGVGSITPAQVDNGSDDNCALVNRVLSQNTFNCSDVGNNTPVVLTVIDQSGNSSTCNTTVMVMDTVRPNMACQPVTVNVHLAPGGTAPVTANLFDAGTNDSCGIANLSFRGAPNFVTCADIGTRPITLIATDANGNVDSCTTTLTVLDTVAPTLVCDTITVDLDNAGVAVVDSATTGLYTVNDACGVVSITLNGGSSVTYSCTDTGFNTISIVATDNSSNSAACVAGVFIRDVTPPVVSCVNTSIQYLDNNGNLTINPATITAGIVEACGVDTIFTTPATFDCSDVGAFNVVSLTVVDNSGNQSSCNGNIEVRDTVPPTMVCRDTTVCLNGGFVNVTPTDVDGGTFDACGLSGIQTINGTNNVIFTCADIGRQPVVLQRQDVNGNTNTCTANVTVQDCTPPTAVCRGIFTAQVGPNGFATVRAIELDFGSNDDCGIDSSSFRVNGRDSILYNCNAINTPDTVLFTVADFAGNLDSCTVIITVEDNTPPIARCGGPINAVLSANNGQFEVPAINLNNTSNSSTDNCTIATFLINGQARDTFDCSMVGSNTAVLTVIDQSGNTDTCHAIVNVRDITSPTINCRFTTNLNLASTGQVALPVANIVLSANDNCGINTILSSGQDTLTFDCNNIGSNAIVVQVTDSSGNSASCNAIVNVRDNISPTAICPTQPVPVYLNAGGIVWTRAQQIDSASFDNCAIIDYQINGTDSVLYNCNQIGQFPTATLTVFDSTGNSDACTVTIDVIDTIAPVARCSSITVNLNPVGQAFVAANRIDSASFDNCTNISFLINGQARDTFDCSNVGTPVNALLTVTDQYNNTSFCATTITVVDVTPPTIQCPPTPLDFYLNNNGLVTVTPQQVANAFDTCAIASWTINGQSRITFDCSDIGTGQLVTIRVADQSGNAVQCNAIINIRDTIAPTQGCSNITVALDSMGTAVVCGVDLMSFNTDNCAIIDTLINGQNCVTYGCNDIGQVSATLTLIDASNNTTTCTSTVTIIDNIAPVVVCDSLVVVQLDPTGTATITPSLIYNTLSEPCGTPTLTLTQTTFSCSDVASNNTVVLTATDASGNASTCSSIIQVEDVTPPVVICRDYDVFLGSTSGTATLFADSIDNGSYDSCGIASIVFNTGSNNMSFNCSDTGTRTVTIVVTDFYGNLDSCSATVTVRDTTPPALICRSLNIDLTNTGQATLTPDNGVNGVVTNSFDNCFIDTIFVSPNSITCTDIGAFAYTVTAIDASGNIGTCQDTVNVTLASPRIRIPTQDTVLCEGSTLPLRATAPSNGIAYNYQWSGPNGVITQNPATRDTTVTGITVADQGWYIFTISRQNGSGCPASDSVFLTVNDVPAPVLTGTPPCEGDTGVVYLSNASAYTGTIIYNWYFNGTPITNTGDSLVIPNMTAADSGNYSMQIQVTQGAAVCSDSSVAGFDYDVLDLPAVPAPIATTPCEGQTLTLINNAPGNSYVWSGPAGFSSTQPIPTRTNATLAFAGLYTLTITDGNGCSNVGSVAVTIRPTPPNPTLLYTQPLCVGDLLELQDTTNYPVPPVIYYWQGPNNIFDTTTVGQLLLPNAGSGIYQLSVAMDGCFSDQPDSVDVQYEPLPVGLDDNFSIQFRDSLVGGNIIINDAPNPAGYTLAIVDSTEGGTASLNVAAGTLNYTPRSGFFGIDTLYYTLCDAQCPNSCDTVGVYIEVITEFECYIPQGLSPNGDGINDQLMIRCKNNYPNAELKIFSRWGTLVYEGEPTGWNGQFNGKDLPDGTYFYVLDLNDTTFTGTGTNKAEGRVGDRYSGYIMLQR